MTQAGPIPSDQHPYEREAVGNTEQRRHRHKEKMAMGRQAEKDVAIKEES